MYNFYVLLLLIFFNVTSLVGQDFFYNSQHFGLQSSLLGGAVTAGNNDLGMAYYNPAALKHVTPQLDVSLFQPRIQRFGFGNLLGKRSRAYNLELGFSPNMTAVRIELFKKMKLTLIVLDKNQWANKVTLQSQSQEEQSLNQRFFVYNYAGSVNWAGAAISLPINESWSFGVSQFLSFSTFEYFYEILDKTGEIGSQVASDLFSENFEIRYGNYSFITKFGFHMKTKKHRCGIVIKTPDFGQVARNGFFNKVTTIINDNENSFSSLTDANLKSSINTPWSIDVGYVFKVKKRENFWMNLSYFTRVPDYDIALVKNQGGDPVSWKSDNESVFNASVGLSGSVSKRLELILGFRTNFFAYENEVIMEEGVERIYFFDKDNYHVTAGAELHSGRNNFSIGTDISVARPKSDNEFVDFPNFSRLETGLSDFSNTRIKLLFTYGFIFNKE